MKNELRCVISRKAGCMRQLFPSVALCALLGVFMICSAQSVMAQPTGSISGMVRDSSGTAMPGVTVQVMNWETGTARRTVTNDGGQYSLDNVASGSVDVTFIGEGFETTNKTVQVGTEPAVFNVQHLPAMLV